jgi:hypothetical protein
VWYFVSNKHYFIDQKRARQTSYKVDPVVKCLWIGIPLLLKDDFFALHHLFIKRKVGIFAFRHILTEL